MFQSRNIIMTPYNGKYCHMAANIGLGLQYPIHELTFLLYLQRDWGRQWDVEYKL